MYWSEIPYDTHHLGVLLGASKLISNRWYVPCKPCIYLASRLVLSSNGPNWAFTWASSPRSTIGCLDNGFWSYGALVANHAPILQRNSHCLQTDQSEIPYDTRHLGDLLGASKLTSEHMVHYMQTMHLPCIKISTISKPSVHLSPFT
jgi:hypothetical protein